MTIIKATELVVGDVVLLDKGWRNVIDVWLNAGFVHAVATDAVGLFEQSEMVEVARRPQPPKLRVVAMNDERKNA